MDDAKYEPNALTQIFTNKPLRGRSALLLDEEDEVAKT